MRPFLENQLKRLRGSMCIPSSFPDHLHTQAELVYLFSGRAVLRIEGAECPLEPGDLCLCFPGVVHGYVRSDGARAVMAIFAPELLPDFAPLLSGRCPTNARLPAPALKSDVASCALHLAAELSGGADEAVIRGYLQVILARVLPCMTLVERRHDEADALYRILEYLSAHFSEPITVNDLSEALALSPSYLSHTFSRRLGTSFRAYVNTLRVDRACILLRQTDYSITRIAYECGFETQRTFNRVFAEQRGRTPGEFRRGGTL